MALELVSARRLIQLRPRLPIYCRLWGQFKGTVKQLPQTWSRRPHGATEAAGARERGWTMAVGHCGVSSECALSMYEYGYMCENICVDECQCVS